MSASPRERGLQSAECAPASQGENPINKPIAGFAYVSPDEALDYAKPARRFDAQCASSVYLTELVADPRFIEVAQKYHVEAGKFVILDTGDNLVSPAVGDARQKDKTRTVYLTTGILRKMKVYFKEKLGSEGEYFLPQGTVLAIFLHEALHPGEYAPHAEEYKADEYATRALADLGFNPERYIYVLETIGDKYGDEASTSHPSASSRIERLRTQVLPDIRRKTQKFTSEEWDNSPLPHEVEKELTELSSNIVEQRSWFIASAEELEHRCRSAQTLQEFWHYFILLSTRRLVASGDSEASHVETGNFFFQKLFVLGRAVKFYEQLQAEFPDIHWLFEAQYELRQSDFAPEYVGDGSIDHVERLFDIDGSWLNAMVYIEGAPVATPLENAIISNAYRVQAAVFLSGFYTYLLGDREHDFSHASRAPIRRWAAKYASQLAQIRSKDIETYNIEELEERYRKGDVYLDGGKFADAIAHRASPPNITDGLIDALFASTRMMLTRRARRDTTGFYNETIALLDGLRKEWKRKTFSSAMLPPRYYDYAFPLSSEWYIAQLNDLTSKRKEEEGTAYSPFDLPTVQFTPDGIARVHNFLGIAFALTKTGQLVELQHFRDEFLRVIDVDEGFQGLGEVIFAGLAYNQWGAWYEAVKALSSDALVYLQQTLQQKARLPISVETRMDDDAVTQGFYDLINLAQTNSLFGNQGSWYYKG